MIDNQVLGSVLYNMRLRAGYDGRKKTTDQFVDDMETHLGYSLSKDSLYKYEKGVARPRFDAVIAWVEVCCPYWLQGMEVLYRIAHKEDK